MACAAVLGSGFAGVAATATAAVPVRAAACGTPLSAGELATITDLSDVDTVAGGDALQRADEFAERNWKISEILVSHGDRRGLFALMDDVADRQTVLPLLHSGAGLADPELQAQFYDGNYESWLRALHAEFTGAPLPKHWTKYFDLAATCTQSPAYTAMVGYNAHMSVDIPHSLAAAGIQGNDPDYFRVLDAIGADNSLIVSQTKAAYNADVGPLWRFYFLGEGLDLVTGPGVGSGQLLRTVLAGVNAANLANGVALQNPVTHDLTSAAIDAQWSVVDTALATLTQIHGL
ncbi:DUF5995 family protein [Nocardia sp. NPDC088792]|uniref:DUF5995 family protein n=1 Tax=Nocardia sp. NPDC088792 TaxID=3364332 RepID=UPI00381F8F21